MKTTKHGFTMIELIFVIVILGILAAIAIPKLSATRDDAKISKMSANLNTLITDLASNYTSQGALDTWKNATNVTLNTDATTAITNTTAVTTAAYLYNNAAQCIKFISTTDGNLTITAGSNTTDVVCKEVQTNQVNKLTSHIFGGTRVKY